MTNIHVKRSGVTLTDVLAATVVVLLTMAFGIAWAQEQDETERRIQCARNLRTVGQAMMLYANDDARGVQWPRTAYSPDLAAHPLTAFTVAEADNPFAMDADKKLKAGQKGDGGAPTYNDVTAAMFMLLRTQDIGPEIFVCPSSGAKPDPMNKENSQGRSNFSGSQHLSYGFASPYPSTASLERGYKWGATAGAEFAVAADRGPGKAAAELAGTDGPADQWRKGNSPNHATDGQNILYADGHVEWLNHPFAGVERDNIYTQAAAEKPNQLDTRSAPGYDGKMSPAHADDSIILPAVKE